MEQSIPRRGGGGIGDESELLSKRERCLCLSGKKIVTGRYENKTFIACGNCVGNIQNNCVFISPTPASLSKDSCRLIVESIHREGNLKPTAHASMPSLERVAIRAAPSLKVRVAS